MSDGGSAKKLLKKKVKGTPGKKGLSSAASTPAGKSAAKKTKKDKTPKLKTPKAAAMTPTAAVSKSSSKTKSTKKEKKLKSAKKSATKKRMAEAEPEADEDDADGNSGNEAGPAILDFDDANADADDDNSKSSGDGDGADPAELQECNKILAEMTPKLEAVTVQAAGLLKQVAGGKLDTTKGISLLEVKMQLMLSYNVALGIFMMLKLEGKKVEGHPIVERMAYLRTLLEKLRPIEARLKYQIDKVLRSTDASAAAAGEAGGSDPLSHKPNAGSLVPKQRGDADRGAGSYSEDGGHGGGLGSGDGIYKPPRMTAMPYDDDMSAEGKKARKAEKDRLRLLNSDMMQELRSEFTTAPEEISHVDAFKSDAQAALKEREDIEENNFVRFGGRKKLLKARARMTSGINEITSFAGTHALASEGRKMGASKSMRQQVAEVRKSKTGGKRQKR